MGSSAGGNITAVLARRARDDTAFPAKITGQVLQIPAVINPSVYPAQYGLFSYLLVGAFIDVHHRLKDQLLSLAQNADTDGYLGAEDVHIAFSKSSYDVRSNVKCD